MKMKLIGKHKPQKVLINRKFYFCHIQTRKLYITFLQRIILGRKNNELIILTARRLKSEMNRINRMLRISNDQVRKNVCFKNYADSD